MQLASLVEAFVTSLVRRGLTVVGLQGVQGTGKSTLAAELCARHPRWRTLSLDDFYLPDDARARVAETEPLWRVRGNPGTHDVALLRRALDALRRGEAARVPVYDKTRHGGRGDRCGWTRVGGDGVDVVLLEGWCVGYEPRGAEAPPELARVDAALEAYAAVWRAHLDGLVRLCPPHLDVVYAWRAQSERAMTPSATRAFVDAYMPAYRAYNDAPPRTVVALRVQLDAGRRAVAHRRVLPSPPLSDTADRSGSPTAARAPRPRCARAGAPQCAPRAGGSRRWRGASRPSAAAARPSTGPPS